MWDRRFNNSNIPSFVAHSETWERVQMIGQLPKNCHKIIPFFDCVKAHCMCIFDHLFLPHPKCKWNKFLFTNLIWMPFIYFIMFCHLCIKHGSLVKFSKIAKIWTWSITFSMVGIFHSLANLFFKKPKDSTWSFLQFCQVEFLKFHILMTLVVMWL